MIADVVLDSPITRLDHPFSYRVPEKIEPFAQVGVVVRVPLRGRKVRGWIVARRPGDVDDLSDIAAVSGQASLFDQALLTTARAVARRYVQPVASVLSLMTPARMGGRRLPEISATGDETKEAIDLGASRKTLWMLGPLEDPVARYVEMIEGVLAKGLGTIVMVPEVKEGSRVLDRLASRFVDDVALVHSGVDEPERSKHLWEVARGQRRVVLGGRAAVFAPAFECGLVIVHNEHDRSLKEQRSPYYDARMVAEIRARETGADLLMASPSPSIGWSSRGGEWEWVSPDRSVERRGWPMVEIVEPAAGGRLPRRVIAAIIETRSQSKKVVVLSPRVGGVSAGTGVREVASYLQRVVPSASISMIARPIGAEEPSGGKDEAELMRGLESDVIVATTAVLADVDRPPIGCGVVLGFDAVLARPYGRAVEDATQELWELARWVGGSYPERGRVVLETRNSDHHAVQGLVRGDYQFFATRELERRKAEESPPFVTLIRLRGPIDDDTTAKLRALPGTQVLGPAPDPDAGRLPASRKGHRLTALLKVADIEAVLDPLREALWSADIGILVEVDPKEW